MKIIVFGATGQVGKRVVNQALAKSWSVKAFGRNVESLIDADLHNENLEAVKGYVFDENDVYNGLQGVDAVVSCLGGSFDGLDKTRSLGIKNIVKQMQKRGISRIVAVGGMGILNADDTTMLIDTPGYPEVYKPVGLEHLAAYRILESSMLQWTFICPPNILDKDATENYTTSENFPPVPDKYQVAAGDIAHCILTCIEKKTYIRSRVGMSEL